MSDVHIPYHDLKACNIALEEFKRARIDTLILNGDILDCYQVSRFNKIPTKKSIDEECDMAVQFLWDIKTFLPKVKIIWKFGNHEERFEDLILNKAPEIWGITLFRLHEVLKWKWDHNLKTGLLDVEFINNKRIIECGKLAIIHGHEYGGSIFSPVNPARGLFIRAYASVLAGHNHQSSEHIQADLNGKIIGTWSTGCLCELHPKFLPLNKWNHGFAIVTVDENRSFEVKNHKIIDGKLV